MVRVTVSTRDGEERTLEGQPNRTLMETIREHGMDELLAICGGCCSCATCHVYVDEAWAQRLPPMSLDEDGMLEGNSYRKPTSRLSCQIRISEALEGLRVEIAPEE
jgi:ferredoxin, 2Fe-2S